MSPLGVAAVTNDIKALLNKVDLNKIEKSEKQDLLDGITLIHDEGLSDKDLIKFNNWIKNGYSIEATIAAHYRRNKAIKYLAQMIKKYGDDVLEKISNRNMEDNYDRWKIKGRIH